jgi:outer membrane immunogenic protein
MLRKLLLSSAALLALAPAAFAAPAAAPFNWSGFYIGAYAGYATGRTTAIDKGDEFGTPEYVLGDKFSFLAANGAFGVQAGYNLQIGNLVVGPEVDAGYLGLRGSAFYAPGITDTYIIGQSHFDATARARVGYAFGQALVYATGGAVFTDQRNQVISFGGIQSPDVSAHAGWAIGGGLEYALTSSWSVKGEYLHYDLGDEIATMSNGVNFKVSNAGDMARLGLNFRFGGL